MYKEDLYFIKVIVQYYFIIFKYCKLYLIDYLTFVILIIFIHFLLFIHLLFYFYALYNPLYNIYSLNKK